MKVQEISMNVTNTIWVGKSHNECAPGYFGSNTIKEASDILKSKGADKIIFSFKSHFDNARVKDIKTFSSRALKIATQSDYTLTSKARNLVIDGYVQDVSFIIEASRNN